MATYKNMAQKVQSKGAKNAPNDSMLAHITPLEAMYLKQRGGSGQTDPSTGIPHFDDGVGDSGPSANENDNGGMSSGLGGFGDPTGPSANEMDNGLNTLGLNGFAEGLGTPGNENDNGGFSTGIADFGQLSDDSGNNSNSIFGKFTQQLQSMLTGKAAAAALGPAAPVAGIAMAGGKGPAAFGNSFGGTLGSIAGSALGGPLGGIAGGAIGSGLGGILGGVDNGGMNGQGAATASANAASGAMGNGWGDALQGLAGMYMGNRQAGQYGQTLNSLNDIYSPNGVYAQQLRQQLERKDAAAGRRSQYGPREAQLMAALAQNQAQTLSSPGYGNLMQQRQRGQNQGLNTIIGLMQKPGGLGQSVSNGVNGMMQGGGLQSLFNNGQSNNWNLGANAGPQMDSGWGGLGDTSGGGLMDGGMWGG